MFSTTFKYLKTKVQCSNFIRCFVINF